MPTPHVTAILPVFNATRTLERAVASLLGQTFGDWELVAVDDASTDDSAHRLETLAARDVRIRVLRQSARQGPAAARNTALKAARGEFVAYLDQLCELDPHFLGRVWSFRDEGDVLVFQDGRAESTAGKHVNREFDTDQATRPLNPAGGPPPDLTGVVHRLSLIRSVGGFDARLEPFAIADLWWRFARAGARFASVPTRAGRRIQPDTTPAFPSPVATVEPQAGAGTYPLLIPAGETWRVQQLFTKHEYGGLPLKLLRPSPTVVDVGANVGVFAAYAKLSYRAGAVHCFEPYPPGIELLRQNAAQFPGVSVHPFGLGREDAEVDLRLDPTNSGANSLKRPAAKSTGCVRVAVRDAAAVWDELGLGEVDVLKVDTEGCEVEILESLGSRLAHVRVVLAEYHTPADRRRIDALLAGHVLFGCLVHSLRRGVVKYVRADLVGVTADE